MGANIDYAIVISSRFMELKDSGVPLKRVVTDTLNQSFPTIVTSGAILASAGLLAISIFYLIDTQKMINSKKNK